MQPRMLVSAGVVGVILVGGVSVTAAASAGRLRQAAPSSSTNPATSGRPGQSGASDAGAAVPGLDPGVVSRELADDPDRVSDYWTIERMRDATPMPIPEVSISLAAPSR